VVGRVDPSGTNADERWGVLDAERNRARNGRAVWKSPESKRTA
jgi:hypothetical protein